MSAAITLGRPEMRRRLPNVVDPWLLGMVVLLLAVGLVMLTSASVGIADKQLGNPWYFVERQLVFLAIGLVGMWLAYEINLKVWQQGAFVLLVAGFLMLVAVVVPGVGREVNGSMRWIALGSFNVQPSEMAKIILLMFTAAYLVRRRDEVRTHWWGLLKPMLVLAIADLLLLAEPDFGAVVVLTLSVLAMIFLAGVHIGRYLLLLVVGGGIGAALVLSSSYRLMRLTAFADPWADPFGKGFQLTQALIAFGRGEWWGVGLGSGVQKLFYLPEAHTDFLFAVMAEETGALGSVAVVGLFVALTLRAFRLALNAERQNQPFAAYLSYGLGSLIGLQAFVNLGVNMGLLPTKGLTLPFMSYGGSSLITTCFAAGLLLRIHRESVAAQASASRVKP